MPCENCRRTGRSCTITINSAMLLPVFVRNNIDLQAGVKEPPTTKIAIVSRLPPFIGVIGSDRAVPYFFRSFLPMNVFISDQSVEVELLAMMTTSEALRDAIHAVAILHRKQQYQLTIGSTKGSSETHQALQAYDRSVRYMQRCIASNAFLQDPSSLWTTFLLGLFEVREIEANSSIAH